MSGEVLHCSSFHPSLVFQTLKTVLPEGNKSVLYYNISVDLTQKNPAVIFDINHPKYVFGEEDPDEVFEAIKRIGQIKAELPNPKAYLCRCSCYDFASGWIDWQ